MDVTKIYIGSDSRFMVISYVMCMMLYSVMRCFVI
jgi:hypothetical protein